ncbi:MAG: hypothetical protein IH987_02575 [Planctomycetes bacterium]|nr:hypothetical protein [Planctomycetota bacterium]
MAHAIVYHPNYQTYNFGPAHPFSPVRLVMLVELLEALDALPDFAEPIPATRDEVLTMHSEAFVEQVEPSSAPPMQVSATSTQVDVAQTQSEPVGFTTGQQLGVQSVAKPSHMPPRSVQSGSVSTVHDTPWQQPP